MKTKSLFCLILLCTSTAIYAQTQHYFKFAIPDEKVFDSSVHFYSELGAFKINEKGNYQIEVGSIIYEQTIYALKNKDIMDSFKTRNLYWVTNFFSDEMNYKNNDTLYWDSVSHLNNIQFLLLDEGEVLDSISLLEANIVLSSKGSIKSKKRLFKKPKFSLDLKEFMAIKTLYSGDIVIITEVLGISLNGDTIKVPGVALVVKNKSEDEKAANLALAQSPNLMVEKTIMSPNSSYYLSGNVIIGNNAALDTVKHIDQEDIIQIIQNANIPGMIGIWKIHESNGRLHATGSIKYDIFTNTYTIANDWRYPI